MKLPEKTTAHELGSAQKLRYTFTAIYLFVSLFALLHFLNSSLLGDHYFQGRVSYQASVDGTAWKPFVFRLLIPVLTKSILVITPNFIESGINDALYQLRFNALAGAIHNIMPWLGDLFPDEKSIYGRLVMITLIYFCLLGYIRAMQCLSRQLFPDNHAIVWFCPIFALLAISSFSTPMQYVYDIPVLFLSTLCYYYMTVCKLNRYLLFFTLACLNKETAIFIIFFFSVWFNRRLPMSTYYLYIGLQCAIFAVIKIAITFVYAANPGPILEQHTMYVLVGDIFATNSYKGILSFSWLFFLFTYDWAHKPAFLKYVFWVIPAVLFAYILYGYPYEYRVFFDILPLLILLASHTLIDMSGLGRHPLFASTPPSHLPQPVIPVTTA